MNKLKERRKRKALCPKCKSPDYKEIESISEERPSFQCGSCGETWSWGKDGGVYKELL